MAAEKLFENKIKRYLDSLGAYHIKYWAGSQFTKSGVPDILACVGGYFVALEVKAQNGKPSELQIHNIKEIKKSGGFAFVVYPSGWTECMSFLNQLKQGYFDAETVAKIEFK